MAPYLREQVISHANGSTANMLKQTGLQAPLVVLPPVGLCKIFEAFGECIHARFEANITESDTLAQLRDTLLPKLISGDLRIADAEKFMEERTL